YPLLDLRRLKIGVRELVRRIEQSIIDTLAEWNVVAVRRDGAPGVYVGEAKIAALGLRVRHGCTFHGLAFNIAMDLEPFHRINPCGYAGLSVTQLLDLGGPSRLADVEDVLIVELGRQFGLSPQDADPALPRAAAGLAAISRHRDFRYFRVGPRRDEPHPPAPRNRTRQRTAGVRFPNRPRKERPRPPAPVAQGMSMLQRVPVILIALVMSLGARAQNPAPPANCPASSSSAPAAAPAAKYKATPAPELKPTAAQGQAAILAARLLTRFQYEALPLDDAMSSKIFDAYFKALDGSRLFFTQQDLDKFAPDRGKLDDAIWNGDMSIPFAIFNLYEKRSGERTAYALALLKQGVKLDGNGTYNFDREKAPWAADNTALDALWKQRVENDWIRLKLAGKGDAEIRKTLSRRYENYLNRVHQLDSQDAFQTFMNAYATTIDPHTNYFGPRASANFDLAMSLSLEGIGAVLQEHDEYTVIREVVPGGPAAKSGKLEVGDKIVGVGQGDCGAIVDTVGWRIGGVVAKIRGKKGTTVRLEVLPAEGGPDAKPHLITLVRQKVTIADQEAKKKVIDVKQGGRTIKVGIIDLPSFYEDFDARRRGDSDYKSASRDVAKLLAQLKAARVSAVVVDLRDNGGGSLEEAINLTGLFTGKGPVVQVRDSRGQVEQKDSDEKMLWTGPMAVLVNRGSASASEI